MPEHPRPTRPRSPRIDPRALPSLRAYLAGNFGLTFANGIQNVVLGWLVAHALHESGSRVGVVYAALMLPNVALALLGGFASDRFDPRRLLPGLHAAGVAAVLTLAAAVAGGWLRYELLVGYALVMGVLAAFISPARDSLLPRVAGGALPRVVPLGQTSVYVGQLLGALAGGLTERIGPELGLGLQAALLGFATLAFALVRPPEPHRGRVASGNPLREIADAARTAFAAPPLRSTLAMNVVIGTTLGGTYVPLMTMITRDSYGGGAAELSLALATMMIGTTTGSVTLALRGGIRRQGRALLLGLAGSAVAVGALAFEPPFALALVVSVFWGLSGAIAVTMARTISQQHAPPAQRARVLSLFHLAVAGSAPLGSLMAGFASDWLGASRAALVPAAALAAAVAITAVVSELPRLESGARRQPQRGPRDDDDQFSSVA